MTPRRVGPEDYEDLGFFATSMAAKAARAEIDFDKGGDGHTMSELSPPHNRTPTSVAAAASKVSDAATERARVYIYLASLGAVGATREEIEDALHMPGNTVRPRVWELMGNGGHVARIMEAGVVRLTRSGRRAEVLVVL